MSTPAENASLPDLMRTLADDARELVRAEVGLARDEVNKSAKALLVVVAGATSATVTAVLALCTFVAAVVLALGVSVRLLSKSGAPKAQLTPQPEPRASEPRLSTNQSEVLR